MKRKHKFEQEERIRKKNKKEIRIRIIKNKKEEQ